MQKPDYLYHGSPKQLEILKPAQATGFSGAGDNKNAVYAVARYELAVAFALSLTAQSDTAVFSVNTEMNPPIIQLKDTLIDWHKTGYIYKLPSTSFQQIAPDQWVSYTAVKTGSLYYEYTRPSQLCCTVSALVYLGMAH